jgi:hypothetical protein
MLFVIYLILGMLFLITTVYLIIRSSEECEEIPVIIGKVVANLFGFGILTLTVGFVSGLFTDLFHEVIDNEEGYYDNTPDEWGPGAESDNGPGYHEVNGYYRSDGTYVEPYIRSNPDGNPYNNINQ